MERYFNVGFAIMFFIFLSPLFRFPQLYSCANLTSTCVEHERQALLKFMNNFQNYTSSYEYRFASWEGEDCCKWKGIGCDAITGHVIKIDLRVKCEQWYDMQCWYWNFSSMLLLRDRADLSSLLELEHLNHLDLSGQMVLGINPFPSFFGSMKQLKYLNLSHSGFGERIPHQLGNLTNLQVLDLGSSDIYIDEFSWISQLSSLQYIDLSRVQIMKPKELMQVISKLPSLLQIHLMYCRIHDFKNFTFAAQVEVLNLRGNSLSGPIPSNALQNMPSIQLLDLSENQLTSSMPSSLGQLKSLMYLSLASNSFSGPIPQSFGKLTNLRELTLADNQLNGTIPASLGRLSSLRVLDLSGNHLKGIIPNNFGNLYNLYTLDLSNNFLEGTINEIHLGNMFAGPIPQSFGKLTNLRELTLADNQLNGTIPASLGRLSSLRVLNLSSNHLKGIIPNNFGNLYNLYILDLSDNSLEGTINEIHLGNMSSMQSLRIGFNNLAVKLKPNWLPPFQLANLQLHSCRIESSFPQWLQTQNKLIKLDLSNTSIEGTIPKGFQQMDLVELDLSNNQISGPIPEDLHDRMPKLNALLLGNNLLNGSIPKGLCELKELYNLDLPKNKLSSNIPDCIGQMASLELINLSSNKLSGTIPNSVCSFPSFALESLNLSNNSLHGELPINLRACVTLTILDVGDNQISGAIPSWIGEYLPWLIVLRLRGNKFNGTIPSSLCQLIQMHILDLAQNNLVGSIPHCIDQLQGMMPHQDESTYEQNATLAPATTALTPAAAPSLVIEAAPLFDQWDKERVNQIIKGREFEYNRNLEFMFNIDLSDNKLIGYIPEGLSALSKLVNLNLSHNHLSGKIPRNIGKMQSLESVDFSDNTLSGIIPDSMSLLTSLSHLNLSYNNFSGPIPQKNQFSTFEDDPSIYVGNPYLCGIPLKNKCPGDEAHQTPSSIGLEEKHGNDDGREKMLFYFVIAVGYVTGFWGVIGVLLLKKNWRHALFGYVEKVADRVYVAVAVRVARLKNTHGN